MSKTLFTTLILTIILSLGNNLYSQLSGIKTIPGDYATLSTAISDLNSQGVGTGGVTFNIAANFTEDISTQLLITATGTQTNPIIFQKSGAGNNPLITRIDTGTLNTTIQGGLGDAIIRIEGSDYITFDGIDITSADAGIEYGFLTHKPNGTNGSQFLTIKNSTITLKREKSLFYHNLYTVGIYIGNGTNVQFQYEGVTVTSEDGKNKNITITGNTIQNCHSGILLVGSSNFGFEDTDIIIGASGQSNTIQNFGSGTFTSSFASFGVRFINVRNPEVSFNILNNYSGSFTASNSAIYGIYFEIANGNIVANNNILNLTNLSSNQPTYFIYNENNATSEVFNNNFFTTPSSSTSTGETYLIYANNNTTTKTISGNSIAGSINTSGDIICYYNFNSTSSTTTETITNNTFKNTFSSPNQRLKYGIYSSHGFSNPGPDKICSGNIIENWNSSSGVVTMGILLHNANNIAAENNKVKNIQGNNTVYGINFNAQTGHLNNNEIGNLNTAGNKVVGINNSFTSSFECYENNIYDLSSSASNGQTFGLHHSGGSCNYYNNFISDLRAEISVLSDAITGIYAYSGNNIGVYNNTIFINAESSGSNFGTSGIFAGDLPTIDLRNNIVVNLSESNGSGKTVILRKSNTDLSKLSLNSNNNCYFFGKPTKSNFFYFDGTNSDETFQSYQNRVFPREDLSFSEDPPFIEASIKPYNLHILNNKLTQIESGGIVISSPVAITNDFDDDKRYPNSGYPEKPGFPPIAPDVGADEFGGEPIDSRAPIISYNLLDNSSSTTTRNFTNVIITDVSGVNNSAGTKPKVYYKKSSNINNFNDNTNSTDGWKFVEANGTTSPFDFTIDYSKIFGGVTLGDVIQYFVVAQDNAPTPNVAINFGEFKSKPLSVNLTSSAFPISGTVNSYSILNSTISGTFTVGSGGDYSTITDAISDISGKESVGPITLELTDNSYNSETFPIIIPEITGLSSTNLLTIKPAEGNTNVTISGSSTTSIFKLDGCDYVVINGSHNGSNSKNLTIENTNIASLTSSIWVESHGQNAGATNVAIKNCKIKTGTNSSLNPTSGITVEEGDNDNLTIQNNEISKASTGIKVTGNINSINDNLIIESNVIGSASPSDIIIFEGISISYSTAQITNNKIFNITGSSSNNIKGINLFNNVTNTIISGNEIFDIINTITSGGSGQGIVVRPNVSANITISNNVIYGLQGKGTDNVTQGIWGILLSNGSDINIYNNSINLYNNAVTTTENDYHGCILIKDGVSNVDIKNNVFSAKGSPGNINFNGGAMFCLYTDNSNFNSIQSDFNNYYDGNNTRTFIGGKGTSLYSTLTQLRFNNSKDKYSVSGNPGFTSNTNLTPDLSNSGSWVLSGNGVHISGLNQDFNGSPRPTEITQGAPDIGAFEFGIPTAEPNITTIPISGIGSYEILVNERETIILNFTQAGNVSSVDVKNYSGKNPPGVNQTSLYMNSYISITPNSGATGFNYDITYIYSEPQRGTILNESDIRLSKSENGGSSWNAYLIQGNAPGQYELNTTDNSVKVYGLNAFSIYTNSDANSPLPVSLSSFQNFISGRDVKLKWTTQSEINNQGFEIERAVLNNEEKRWIKIGFVNGNGNSGSQKNYSYDDRKLETGKYKYRLKQIDYNGNYEYFELEGQVEIGVPAVFNLSQNYPNPFNPTTKIDINIPSESKVSLIVFDVSGREVKKLINNELKSPGYYTVSFNASELSSGVYFYRIIAEVKGQNLVMTKKMVLIR